LGRLVPWPGILGPERVAEPEQALVLIGLLGGDLLARGVDALDELLGELRAGCDGDGHGSKD
jgi:hypothetical protein